MNELIGRTSSELFFESVVDSYLQIPRRLPRHWLHRTVVPALDDPNKPYVLLTH